ncbi:hypothetical protein A8C56_02955 [Niabella ginsenosidivorans]|uniref:Uncharacterized protein n=1 Tax=Niabella ginsenosidivorans TaxID=1176587 RepID=A0A1A9I020_9BACT|nr:hypothetical protein [Niabella ginsenosidivorans]ANH80080.1 hypothetical protein A8C56_02955 [Niabella ginsenosidivorans]
MQQAGINIVAKWSDEEVQAGIAKLKKTLDNLGLSNLSVDSSGAVRSINTAKSAIQQLKEAVKNAKDNLQSFLAGGGSVSSATGKQLADTYNQLNEQLQKINRTTKGTQDAYARLAQLANEATRWAQQLGARYGETSEQFLNASKRADNLTQKLKDIDAATGRNFRNVGNYASAWNPVQNSINQITREMPAFVNSMQTGFMAISNNIAPLADALTDLKNKNKELAAQGKPTQTALSAVGGALFSWNTLLLAGVTALTAYGPKLVDFITGHKKATEAEKQAEKELESLAKTYADSLVKLTALYGITQNHNTSLSDKKKAVQAVNQEYGQYLTNLGKEKATLDNITQAYNQVIDQMLRQAVVKGLQDQISKQVEETAKQLIKLELQEKKRQQAEEAGKNAAQKRAAAEKTYNEQKIQQGADVTRIVRDGVLAQIASNNVMNAQIQTQSSFEARQQAIKQALMDSLKPALQLVDKYDDLGIKLDKIKPDKISDAKKANDDFRDSLDALKAQIENGLISPLDATKEKVRILNDYYKKLTGDLKQNPESPFVKKIAEQLRDAQNAVMAFNAEARRMDPELGKRASESLYQSLAKMRDLTAKENPMLQLETSIQFNPAKALIDAKVPEQLQAFTKSINDQFNITKDSLQDMIAKTNSLSKDISDAYKNLGVSAIEGLGESIGAAIGKKGGFKDILNDLLHMMGQWIADYGKKLVEMGTLLVTAGSLLSEFGGGVLVKKGVKDMIAGGLLIVGGNVLKSVNIGGSSRAFANGGIVYGPTQALVGEYPGASSNPEVIAPLNKLTDIMGGVGGNDYTFTLKKAVTGEEMDLMITRHKIKTTRR